MWLSRAMRPVHGLNEVARRHPLKTSVGVTTVKAGLADAVVQRHVERRPELDRRRVATFMIFGCCYQGGFQYWMFNVWFERLFPGRALGEALARSCAHPSMIAQLRRERDEHASACFYGMYSRDTAHSADAEKNRDHQPGRRPCLLLPRLLFSEGGHESLSA